MIVWKVLETLENKKVNNLKSPNGTNIIFNHLMRELGMKNYFELPRILKTTQPRIFGTHFYTKSNCVKSAVFVSNGYIQVIWFGISKTFICEVNDDVQEITNLILNKNFSKSHPETFRLNKEFVVIKGLYHFKMDDFIYEF